MLQRPKQELNPRVDKPGVVSSICVMGEEVRDGRLVLLKSSAAERRRIARFSLTEHIPTYLSLER